MSQALLKGAEGTVKRERAPGLQPEALKVFTFAGVLSRYPTHNATTRSGQAENRFPVGPAVDAATREVTNPGHLAKAIVGVHAVKQLRYDRKRVPVEAARDLYRVLTAIEAAAMVRNPNFTPDLHDWSARHLCLSEAAKAEVRAELAEHAPIISARFLGEQLGLTDAERDRAKFWGAEAVDMTAARTVTKNQDKDAERQRAKRRKAGVPPKGEALTLVRLLYPNASPSTQARRARDLKRASNA